MVFKQFYLNCLAHASYLIGDESTKTAAVVDPQRDVEQYLDFAERLADKYVIMAKGAVVASGATRDLRPEMVRQHLAV